MESPGSGVRAGRRRKGADVGPVGLGVPASSCQPPGDGSVYASSLLERWARPRALVVIVVAALAIRLYLVATSACISADGPEYMRMARDFAQGYYRAALGSVFSPLYPWLISLGIRISGSAGELGAELISAAFGTAAVALLFLLVKEVTDRRDLAAGAAVLAAIHPDLAAYSASVRTEAGFVCLMVGSLYLLVAGLRRNNYAATAAAGLVGGLAYLYRAEGIGLLVVCNAFMVKSALSGRPLRRGLAVRAMLAFSIPFLLFAAPYLIYLRHATGHWTAGREMNAAAASSVMEVVRNKSAWRAMVHSGNSAILAPLLLNPRTYLFKVGFDLWMSSYYFLEAIGPPLAILLVAGLWVRGRGLMSNWREALLAWLVGFYFVGFALFNTGPRLMSHLIPYTFGWAALGFEWLGLVLNRRWASTSPRLVASLIAAGLGLIILPRTLWPLGYDLRGLREAGIEIGRRSPPSMAVAACDPRVAYYADRAYVRLPNQSKPRMCKWLSEHHKVGYVVVASHNESHWGTNLRGDSCLSFVRRYPRPRGRYYDLFEVLGNK